MPDAVRIMKQYEWPGNVRELKHFVEKVLVLERGERITSQIVEKELMDFMPLSPSYNPALPIVVHDTTERAEIDLILRQLFMLKQDTELIQKMLVNNSPHSPGDVTYSGSNSIESGIPIPQKSMEIVEEGYRFIRDDAIGDMMIKDLEKEAIKRTLKFFNNNRRKTARSLGMSERTLYRKIEEFGLEPKIKRNK